MCLEKLFFLPLDFCFVPLFFHHTTPNEFLFTTEMWLLLTFYMLDSKKA